MANTPKNTVEYGLQSVHYAIATIDPSTQAVTYGTPVAIPGAVNLNMEQSGDSNIFYADNRAYFTSFSAAGYEGDLEIATVPESFLIDVLGYTKDGDMLVENTNAVNKQFALLFEFSGDSQSTRHVLYLCTASRPAIGSETTGENVEVKTRTLNLTAAARPDNHNIYARAGKDDTRYESWFTSVPEPSSSNP